MAQLSPNPAGSISCQPATRVYVAAALFSLLVHSSCLLASYFWDDHYFVHNSPVFSGNLIAAWLNPLLPQHGGTYYRPVPFFLFGIVARFFGTTSPLPFHVLSWLTFAFATLTTLRLARHLFNTRWAFFLVLLFVVYPTHVEAVAWISAWPDLLVFLFSTLYFDRLLTEHERHLPSVWLLSLFTLALLSKESAVSLLPFTFLSFPLRNRSDLVRALRFSAPLLLVFFVYWTLHQNIADTRHPLSLRFDVTFRSLGMYVVKLIKPWPLSAIIGNQERGWDAYAFLGLGALCLLLLGIRHQQPTLRYISAFSLAAWLPYSHVFLFSPAESSLIAERYMLPFTFSALCLVFYLFQSIPINKHVRLLSYFGFIIAYSTTMFAQYQRWKDEASLWQATIRAEPDKAGPYFRLARLRLDADADTEALDLVETGLRRFGQPQYRASSQPLQIMISATARDVYYANGHYDKALKYARYRYHLQPSAEQAALGVAIHDHRLHHEAARAAALRAVQEYPTDTTLAVLALKYSAFSGHTNTLQVVSGPQRSDSELLKQAHATFISDYARSFTLASFTRGLFFYDRGLIALAFTQFAASATSLTAEQSVAIAEIAYREKLWSQSEHFFAIAFQNTAHQPVSWLVRRAMVLQRLGRFVEACDYLERALSEAHPDEKETIRKIAALCISTPA